jgi:predicted permease
MGYDRENIFMFSVNAKLAGYPNDRAAALYRELIEKLQALPNVQSTSLSRVRPVDNEMYVVNRVNEVDGHKLTEHDSIRVASNSIGPGYFFTVKTPILLGREFNLRDDEGAPKVVIVNESLARRALPGQNPIGHRLGGATIIGVVKDSRYGGPREWPRSVLYRALLQSAIDGDVSVEVRQRAGGDLLQDTRREIASLDRNLPIFRAATLREQTQSSMLRERLLATLSTFFGVVALFLACVGIYGLMAYAVAGRTAEIGMRMALGARRRDVVWLVLREAIMLALAGVAAGVPAALWAARYAKSLLFGVSATDPAVVVGSIAIMAGVAILASYLPARRASRIDPMAALRYE